MEYAACPNCNRRFWKTRKNKKYCTPSCQVEYQKVLYREKANKRTYDKILCMECGEIFESGYGRKFCCEECKKNYQRKLHTRNERLRRERYNMRDIEIDPKWLRRKKNNDDLILV